MSIRGEMISQFFHGIGDLTRWFTVRLVSCNTSKRHSKYLGRHYSCTKSLTCFPPGGWPIPAAARPVARGALSRSAVVAGRAAPRHASPRDFNYNHGAHGFFGQPGRGHRSARRGGAGRAACVTPPRPRDVSSPILPPFLRLFVTSYNHPFFRFYFLAFHCPKGGRGLNGFKKPRPALWRRCKGWAGRGAPRIAAKSPGAVSGTAFAFVPAVGSASIPPMHSARMNARPGGAGRGWASINE